MEQYINIYGNTPTNTQVVGNTFLSSFINQTIIGTAGQREFELETIPENIESLIIFRNSSFVPLSSYNIVDGKIVLVSTTASSVAGEIWSILNISATETEGIALENLSNVSEYTPIDGQILKYDETTNSWIPQSIDIGNTYKTNFEIISLPPAIEGQTIFDITVSPVDNNNVIIIMNGGILPPSKYSINSNILTLNNAACVGTEIRVMYLKNVLADDLSLEDLTNVSTTSPFNNQVLTYDSSISRWRPKDIVQVMKSNVLYWFENAYAGQTTFSNLPLDFSLGSSNDIQVFVNGKLFPKSTYTTELNVLTFLSPLNLNDLVEITQFVAIGDNSFILSSLVDVENITPENNNFLVYNSNTHKWTAKAVDFNPNSAATINTVNKVMIGGTTVVPLPTVPNPDKSKILVFKNNIPLDDNEFHIVGDTLVLSVPAITNDKIKAIIFDVASVNGLDIEELSNVSNTPPQNGQYLRYNSGIGKWEAFTLNITSYSLSSLTDVAMLSVNNNDVLIFNSDSNKWVSKKLRTLDLEDISPILPINGQILVYNNITEQWTPANIPTVDGGQTLIPSLNDILDVDVENPLNNQVLAYSSLYEKWIAVNRDYITVLNDLLDVQFTTTPTEGQILAYNSNVGKWTAVDKSHAVISLLNDIDDVDAPDPGDRQILAYSCGSSKWIPMNIWDITIQKLNNIQDVNVPVPLDKQVLTYNQANQQWIASNPPDLSTYKLNDLFDVNVPTPQNGQTLVYQSLSNRWIVENKVRNLSDLNDVFIANPGNNHILSYNSYAGKWLSVPFTQADIQNLSDLNDVGTNPPTDRAVLSYNMTIGKWDSMALNSLGLTLDDLYDVESVTPLDNQVLAYNTVTNKWYPSDRETVITKLSEIGDVNAPAPNDRQILAYDGPSKTWVAINKENTTVTSLNDIGDVNAQSPSNNQVLSFYNGYWVARTVNECEPNKSLNDLTNVSISAPSDGQGLVYNATLGKWVAKTLSTGTGSGIAYLPDLVDVDILNPLNNNLLAYDTSTHTWKNKALGLSDLGNVNVNFPTDKAIMHYDIDSGKWIAKTANELGITSGGGNANMNWTEVNTNHVCIDGENILLNNSTAITISLPTSGKQIRVADFRGTLSDSTSVTISGRIMGTSSIVITNPHISLTFAYKDPSYGWAIVL